MKGRGVCGEALAECLERRLFLDRAFAHLSARGTLIVTGDANANTIVFDVTPDDNLQVRITMDAQTLDFPSADVRRLYIDAGDGNDFIASTMRLRSTILGGIGDDSILGGFADDSILGGDGNDAIKGRSGADIIDGGLGNDVMEGDAGEDTISFYSSSTGF